jgi:hypothetical protein
MVRGWIECEHQAVATLELVARRAWFVGSERLIGRGVIELYWRGWHFPDRPLNWLSVVTYGACVRSAWVGEIRDCMERLAQAGLDARGCFFLDAEEQICRRWRFDETGRFEDVEDQPIFEEP